MSDRTLFVTPSTTRGGRTKIGAVTKRPPAPEQDQDAEPSSPLELLLDQVRSALALKRRDELARLRHLEAAVRAYGQAVEQHLVVEFARDHQLRLPPGAAAGPSPEQAAGRLRDAVLALPELATPQASSAPRPSPPAARESVIERPPSSPPEATATPLPRLLGRAQGRKLVIVGVLAGREKNAALPAELLPHLEWVDTEGGGVHAIGNLPQRIRQGRVAALVILDRAVQHRHTEPLLSAARAVGVPVGFAGKGGAASIRRALGELERQLSGGAG